MERAHRIIDMAGAPGMGASIAIPGSLPVKLATVTAEVLARLLAGERLTSLDAVAEANTTRLAAVVNYLQDAYGWPIDRTDKAVGCKDGRVALVSVYFLDPGVIVAAMDSGAADWCAAVRAARLHLRTKAAAARAAAKSANQAARHVRQRQPGQWALFEGEGTAA